VFVMNNKQAWILGFLVSVLACGLIVAGCVVGLPTGPGDDDDDDFSDDDFGDDDDFADDDAADDDAADDDTGDDDAADDDAADDDTGDDDTGGGAYTCHTFCASGTAQCYTFDPDCLAVCMDWFTAQHLSCISLCPEVVTPTVETCECSDICLDDLLNP